MDPEPSGQTQFETRTSLQLSALTQSDLQKRKSHSFGLEMLLILKKYPKYNIYTCELTMASQVFKRTLVFFYLVYFAELGLRPPIEVPT